MKPQEFSLPSLGQPQRPSAFARFVGLARGFAGNTLLLGVAIMGAEKLFEHEYKPSTMMGRFLGSIEKTETIVKQDAAVEFARRNAEAQAAAQAHGAIEVEINRQQQQVMADSLAGQSAMANLTDLGCFLGALVPADATDGWQKLGAIARSGCGASSTIRQNMVREQANAGRQGGSIQTRQPDYSDLNRDPDGIRPAAVPSEPPKPKRFRPYGPMPGDEDAPRAAAAAPRAFPSLNEFLGPTARRSMYEPPELAEQRKYYPKD